MNFTRAALLTITVLLFEKGEMLKCYECKGKNCNSGTCTAADIVGRKGVCIIEIGFVGSKDAHIQGCRASDDKDIGCDYDNGVYRCTCNNTDYCNVPSIVITVDLPTPITTIPLPATATTMQNLSSRSDSGAIITKVTSRKVRNDSISTPSKAPTVPKKEGNKKTVWYALIFIVFALLLILIIAIAVIVRRRKQPEKGGRPEVHAGEPPMVSERSSKKLSMTQQSPKSQISPHSKTHQSSPRLSVSKGSIQKSSARASVSGKTNKSSNIVKELKASVRSTA